MTIFMFYLILGVFVKIVANIIGFFESKKNPEVEKEFYDALDNYVKKLRCDPQLLFIKNGGKRELKKTKAKGLISFLIYIILWPVMVLFLLSCLFSWKGPTAKITEAMRGWLKNH